MSLLETAPPAADGPSADTTPAELQGFSLPRKTKLLILLGAMLSMFMSSMEQTVVATAIPRIVSSLGGFELIAWVTTSFMLTSVSVVPIAGRLSDVYGRKPFVVGGLIVFLAGSALCGFAQDMTQLVTFRGLQGIGAGILMASTMAITGDLFPPKERGKYMGIFAGVFGISAIIGPTLGGFLTDHLSWRWVFWINVPPGILSVIVITAFMPWIRRPAQRVRLDYLGVATLIWALVPGLLGLAFVGGDSEFRDPEILALFAASGVGLLAFVLAERRAADPIIPGHLLRNRTYSLAAITMFSMGVGIFAVTFFVPLFVQGVVGRSATESGTIITPQMLGIVLMAAISGQIMSRTGRYKFMAVAGSLVVLLGVLLLTQMNTQTSFFGVLWRTVIFGLGMGLVMPVLMLATQNAVPQRYLGTVTSTTQFFQQVGGLIGITIFGTLLSTQVASDLRGVLPPDLAAVADPQRLVDPDQAAALAQSLGEERFAEVALAIREALSSAITGNYWISAGLAAFVVVAMLFLKELRLRSAHEADTEHDGAAAPRIRPAAAPPLAPITELAPPGMSTPPPDPDPPPESAAPPSRAPRAPARSEGWAAVMQRLWDLRLPPLPSPQEVARHQAGRALLLGVVAGLTMAVSVRGQRAREAEARRRAQARRDRRGLVWDVRLILADWLDPPGRRR